MELFIFFKLLTIYLAGFQCYEYLCSDINECASGAHDCSTTAICTNTPGSYQCTCRPFYVGNGNVCFFLGCPEDVTPNCFTCSVNRELITDGDCVSCPDDDESLDVCFTCPYNSALGPTNACNNVAVVGEGKRQTDKQTAVADPGFLRGGGNQKGVGTNLLIFPNFPQNCMKMKSFGPRGGPVPGAPFRSANEQTDRHKV